MAAKRTRYTVDQVLEHIFEEGSNSEGQSTEDEEVREDDEFLFDDIPNNGTETVSFVNTRPAPAPACVCVCVGGGGGVQGESE